MVEIAEIESYLQELAQGVEQNRGNFPETAPRESIIGLFKEILTQTDVVRNAKVANLKDSELGSPRLPVRAWFSAGLYAEAEGFTGVRDYFTAKADVINFTSLARDGKLLATPFTVNRVSRNLGVPKRVVKSGLFGSSETVEGVES